MADRNTDQDRRDPLEAELESFRPQPVSLELRERIGAELTRRPIRWVAALAGLAAAACVAIGFVLWSRSITGVTDVFPPPVSVQTNSEFLPPTLMDYQRAAFESSDALDAMLARPAGRETPHRDARAAEPVRAFSRSFIDFTHSTGD